MPVLPACLAVAALGVFLLSIRGDTDPITGPGWKMPATVLSFVALWGCVLWAVGAFDGDTPPTDADTCVPGVPYDGC